MPDEHLRNHVLQRADDEHGLSEQARLVVFAAFGEDGDLVDALGAPEAGLGVPAGVYLTSIAVRGFGGIGADVTVQLHPGPGLVVVGDRAGSGTSMLAGALDLALTGVDSRWANRAETWSQVWRDSSAGSPASIRVDMVVQGSEVAVGVDWPTGNVPQTDLTRWAQRAGREREDPVALGWASALETYRPTVGDGSLDAERLSLAMARLDAEVEALDEPAAVLEKSSAALHPATTPLAWREAAVLAMPSTDDVERAAATLRAAATQRNRAERTADALAADRIQFLETSLEFHDRHGKQPCPVCAEGTLDDAWVAQARAALAREQEAAGALRVARSATHRARQALAGLVRAASAPPAEDADLTSIAAARAAYEAFSALPVDGDVALADHVVSTLPGVQSAYDRLRAEAAGLIGGRDDTAAAESKRKVVREARKWLQDNAATLRHEQLAPVAVGILRATRDASPVRFVVLDDPIQAMDPSNIKGFLSVVDLAADRQVIVFSHDDRLPAAIRRSGAPARIVDVVRTAHFGVTTG